jgi:hypothetical protein
VVNNAGIVGGGGPEEWFTVDDYKEVYAILEKFCGRSFETVTAHGVEFGILVEFVWKSGWLK